MNCPGFSTSLPLTPQEEFCAHANGSNGYPFSPPCLICLVISFDLLSSTSTGSSCCSRVLFLAFFPYHLLSFLGFLILLLSLFPIILPPYVLILRICLFSHIFPVEHPCIIFEHDLLTSLRYLVNPTSLGDLGGIRGPNNHQIPDRPPNHR